MVKSSSNKEVMDEESRTLLGLFNPLHQRLRKRFNWYHAWHKKKYHKHVHWLGLLVYLAGLGFLAWVIVTASLPKVARAEITTPTVSGKATILSTNGDLDFNVSPYASNVTIDDVTREFSGYAWSVDVGWVSFGSQDNEAGPVVVNQVSGALSGKAKILDTGGFIDFNASPSGSNVTINYQGAFSGYGWSEDLGWINFTGVSVNDLSLGSPLAPQAIRIYDVSDRNLADYAVLVRWQIPTELDVPNFQAYLVERSTNGTDFTQQSSTTSLAYYDTNVTTGTEYFYRIKTQNKTGTTETSSIVSMTPTGKYTTPPTLVSGPTVTVNPTSILVSWVTNRESSSFVQVNEGNVFVSEQGQTEQVTTHQVKVVGLKSKRDYSFSIRSVDQDGNVLLGNPNIITTANTPSIYELSISNITQSTAIVNFKSTAIANFTLHYGLTADYGKTVTESADQKTSNHSIALNSLEPGKPYFFRVVGYDSEDNEIRSENSFLTLPMPEIDKFGIEPVKDAPSTTLKVAWKSNVPTSSVVKFSADNEKFHEQASSELTTDHEVILADLEDSSTYTIFASGRDQFGNLAESPSVSYNTPKDSRPPNISNIMIETSNVGNSSDSKARVVVSYRTDEPTTSQIEFGEGLGGSEYSRKTQLDTTLTNNHINIISDMEPGKPYHIRILATDRAGNLTMSNDNAVITGEVSRSAFQVILGTLENLFGWLGRFVN